MTVGEMIAAHHRDAALLQACRDENARAAVPAFAAMSMALMWAHILGGYEERESVSDRQLALADREARATRAGLQSHIRILVERVAHLEAECGMLRKIVGAYAAHVSENEGTAFLEQPVDKLDRAANAMLHRIVADAEEAAAMAATGIEEEHRQRWLGFAADLRAYAEKESGNV